MQRYSNPTIHNIFTSIHNTSTSVHTYSAFLHIIPPPFTIFPPPFTNFPFVHRYFLPPPFMVLFFPFAVFHLHPYYLFLHLQFSLPLFNIFFLLPYFSPSTHNNPFSIHIISASVPKISSYIHSIFLLPFIIYPPQHTVLSSSFHSISISVQRFSSSLAAIPFPCIRFLPLFIVVLSLFVIVLPLFIVSPSPLIIFRTH